MNERTGAINRRGPRGPHALRRKPRSEPAVATGLPNWFFWLLGVSLLLAVLFPYPAVKMALLVVFGFAYASFYQSHPERTLMAFIVGMPALILIPTNLLPIPGMNAETIVVISLMVAAGISKSHQPRPAPKNVFLAPAIYYACVLVISATLSYLEGKPKIYTWQGLIPLGPRELIAALKNQVFFVFLAAIAFRLFWKKEHVRSAVQLIALATLLVSLHSLWQLSDEIIAGNLGGRNRAVGLMALQPNLFGGFLALMVSILFSLVIGAKTKGWERLLYVSSLGVSSIALLYTFSRGSWLGLIAGLACLGFLRGAKVSMLIMLVLLTAPIWVPDSVIERVTSTVENEDSRGPYEGSTMTRLDQWMAMPILLLESPLLGHGYKSFEELWFLRGYHDRPVAAHSSIVEITVEDGLAGLAAYIWLVVTLALAGWRVRRRAQDPFMKALAAGFVAAIICLVVLDGSGTRFRDRGVMGYVWILGGTLARAAHTLREEQEPTSLPRSSRGRPAGK